MSITLVHSSIKMEVIGPNKLRKIGSKGNNKEVVQIEDGKVTNVSHGWVGNKKKRIKIVVGQNRIPTEALSWRFFKDLEAKGLITVGKTIGTPDTKSIKKKVKPATKKRKTKNKTAVKESVIPVEPVVNESDGLPPVE